MEEIFGPVLSVLEERWGPGLGEHGRAMPSNANPGIKKNPVD